MINHLSDVAAKPVASVGAIRPTYVHRIVLGLTFLVAFIMYIDRAVIGVATPVMMREFGLTKITMGWSVSAFNWSYALLQVPGGWMADRFGPRLVLALAMTWWSVFTAATGLVTGAIPLAITRGLFGAGEAAAFPAASRSLGPWLPESQRAFGQGFQHSGSRFGAAVAPALVVSMMVFFSWRAVFYLLGAVGVLGACIWYAYYRDRPNEHASVNAEELALLPAPKAFAAKQPVPWRLILRSRDLWFLSVMYFCYGWVLWMYLTWLPTYLAEARSFTQLRVGIGATLPLLAATVTHAAGGWISDKLTAYWDDRRRGRIRVSVIGFAIAAIALIPGVLASDANTAMFWLVVALAGLELTVAVSWAICLDIGGGFSGSVSGVMNTFGNLGGAVSAVVIGYLATFLGWTYPYYDVQRPVYAGGCTGLEDRPTTIGRGIH
ncbi:MAG: MFS transporter [Vicinamibacterales bacterium]|nr:MFS transporter [Vicinamibacterales bacterium]